MNQKYFLDNLSTASESEIVEAMNSKIRMASSFAAFEAVKRKLSDEQIADGLKKMTSDNQFFWEPYHVSDLAHAALHILGLQKYSGNDPNVLYWIDAKMDIGLQL